MSVDTVLEECGYETWNRQKFSRYIVVWLWVGQKTVFASSSSQLDRDDNLIATGTQKKKKRLY